MANSKNIDLGKTTADTLNIFSIKHTVRYLFDQIWQTQDYINFVFENGLFTPAFATATVGTLRNFLPWQLQVGK